MGELVQRTWSFERRWHIGDVAWSGCQWLDRDDWPTALWLGVDGRANAWAWIEQPESLNIVVEPTYKERAFIGAGLRMQVSLEPTWLESVWQMFIGVQSPLSSEECIRLLTKPGQLDMKIGSSDRVDDIFRLGQAGLKFAYSPRPPRALPSLPGLNYFQVSRESQAEEWQNVQKSLTLAIRLNENRVAGSIQGQRILTVKTGGQNTTLQFTLFVVPQEK